MKNIVKAVGWSVVVVAALPFVFIGDIVAYLRARRDNQEGVK